MKRGASGSQEDLCKSKRQKTEDTPNLLLRNEGEASVGDNNDAILCAAIEDNGSTDKDEADAAVNINFAIRFAAKNNYFKVVRLLLEDPGVSPNSINQTDAEGNTLLHHIVKERPLNPTADHNVVAMLIEAGSNVNAKNIYGIAPLHMVNNTADAELLFKNGAILDEFDDNRATPFHHAAKRCNLELCKWFVENKSLGRYLADKDQRNIMHYAKEGKNPIFYKSLKPLVNFPKDCLSILHDFFTNVIQKGLKYADDSNKKLIVLLGELHGQYVGYQVEKIVLKICQTLGITNSILELPNEKLHEIATRNEYMPYIYAKKLKYEIIGGDNNRPEIHDVLSTEIRILRNKGISETINKTKKHQVDIVGVNHLYGLLDFEETKINLNEFFIIPLSFSFPRPLLTMFEQKFAHDPSNVIQLYSSGFKTDEAYNVICKWNNLSHF